jgi:type IV pilus assembly protein PilA
MRRARGFTLVELMIVVAIIGVLAALALYGVSRYLKHSKTAEATANLGSIENGARQQYQRETPWGSTAADSQLFVHTFCSTTALTPPTIAKAAKTRPAAGAWDSDGWRCLKFNLQDPLFYSYIYVSNSATGTAASYTASAYGDLDGNDNVSTFELSAHGGPVGDAVRDAFRVINEDE